MLTNLSSGWNPRAFTATDGSVLQFQIHMPGTLAAGREYPLIIYMHGAGSKRDDNSHIYSPYAHFLRWFENDPLREEAILLAPGCPKNGGWVQTRAKEQTEFDFRVSPTVQMQAVMELLDKVTAALPIDEKRLYVHGGSMGAHATWELLARFPNRFAAAIPMCGCGDPAMAEKKLATAIWIFHGDADETVPYECSVKMHRALVEAGHKNVRFTTFEGGKHNIGVATTNTEGLIEWLFTQSL